MNRKQRRIAERSGKPLTVGIGVAVNHENKTLRVKLSHKADHFNLTLDGAKQLVELITKGMTEVSHGDGV